MAIHFFHYDSPPGISIEVMRTFEYLNAINENTQPPVSENQYIKKEIEDNENLIKKMSAETDADKANSDKALLSYLEQRQTGLREKLAEKQKFDKELIKNTGNPQKTIQNEKEYQTLLAGECDWRVEDKGSYILITVSGLSEKYKRNGRFVATFKFTVRPNSYYFLSYFDMYNQGIALDCIDTKAMFDKLGRRKWGFFMGKHTHLGRVGMTGKDIIIIAPTCSKDIPGVINHTRKRTKGLPKPGEQDRHGWVEMVIETIPEFKKVFEMAKGY